MAQKYRSNFLHIGTVKNCIIISYNKFSLISSLHCWKFHKASCISKLNDENEKRKRHIRIKCNSLRQFSVITDPSSLSYPHHTHEQFHIEKKRKESKRNRHYGPRKKEIKKMETRNCNKKDEWVWGQNILYIVLHLCACSSLS